MVWNITKKQNSEQNCVKEFWCFLLKIKHFFANHFGEKWSIKYFRLCPGNKKNCLFWEKKKANKSHISWLSSFSENAQKLDFLQRGGISKIAPTPAWGHFFCHFFGFFDFAYSLKMIKMTKLVPLLLKKKKPALTSHFNLRSLWKEINQQCQNRF